MRLNLTANSFIFGHTNRENLSKTFSVNFGGGKLPKCIWTSRQTVSFLDAQIFITHPNSFHKPCKARPSKMRLNLTANNFVFECTNLEKAPTTLLTKLAKRKLPHCIWTSLQTASFLDAQIVELRPHFFFKTCRQRTSRMHLNFTATSFIFERTNRRIEPTTFSLKLAGRELPECVWTSRKTASFLSTQIVELPPQLFLYNLQAENFQNVSELHGKQLRFWVHKSWNCTHNFFCKTRRQRSSRMRLNFTANSFIFGCINQENAPTTFFMKLGRWKLPNWVWTSQQTASFLDA